MLMSGGSGACETQSCKLDEITMMLRRGDCVAKCALSNQLEVTKMDASDTKIDKEAHISHATEKSPLEVQAQEWIARSQVCEGTATFTPRADERTRLPQMVQKETT